MGSRISMKYFFLILVFSLCCIASGSAQTAKDTAVDYQFSLKNFDGVRYDWKSLVDSNKTVIVSFWASYCLPCLKELDELNVLGASYSAKGVQIVTINIDMRQDMMKARRIVLQKKLKLPVLSDETGNVRKQYRVNAIPRLFIFSQGGVLKYEHQGFKEIKDIEQEVLSLI
ncbi:MAG: TlpA family protein disulfide reductase, partial [Ignavibacteriae bacterium]